MSDNRRVLARCLVDDFAVARQKPDIGRGDLLGVFRQSEHEMKQDSRPDGRDLFEDAWFDAITILSLKTLRIKTMAAAFDPVLRRRKSSNAQPTKVFGRSAVCLEPAQARPICLRRAEPAQSRPDAV